METSNIQMFSLKHQRTSSQASDAVGAEGHSLQGETSGSGSISRSFYLAHWESLPSKLPIHYPPAPYITAQMEKCTNKMDIWGHDGEYKDLKHYVQSTDCLKDLGVWMD